MVEMVVPERGEQIECNPLNSKKTFWGCQFLTWWGCWAKLGKVMELFASDDGDVKKLRLLFACLFDSGTCCA